MPRDDLAPDQVFELALRLSVMGPGDIEDLNRRRPGLIQAVALLAAELFVRHGYDEDPEPPKAA